MKPRYQEEIEIIGKVDGSLICQLRWEKLFWEMELPRGIDRWPQKEFKLYLSQKVIPALRSKMLAAQKESLDTGKIDPTDCTPAIEFSTTDVEAMNKAHAKRERRAALRRKNNH